MHTYPIDGRVGAFSTKNKDNETTIMPIANDLNASINHEFDKMSIVHTDADICKNRFGIFLYS